LEEELAEARSELETLRESTADRAARAAQLETETSELHAELSSAREAHEGELSAANERAVALEERVRGAALRYRELVLRQSPELPEELVAGESIEEIEEALTRARETVAKVRGHIESEAQAGRVPVGAPARSGPDLSRLSADEKIRLGLEQRTRS
jgi:DNA repair exonuclease SbcCD ATPase subunit